jgi:hypothetical protein
VIDVYRGGILVRVLGRWGGSQDVKLKVRVRVWDTSCAFSTSCPNLASGPAWLGIL